MPAETKLKRNFPLKLPKSSDESSINSKSNSKLIKWSKRSTSDLLTNSSESVNNSRTRAKSEISANRNIKKKCLVTELSGEKMKKNASQFRTSMGEYNPPKEELPLSNLVIFLKATPTPGPLDYTPKLFPIGVQYSILGKHEPLKAEIANCGPGPAKYNVRMIEKTLNDPPHWSFGIKIPEKRDESVNTPSPFTYSDKHKKTGTDSIAISISGRQHLTYNETPGPNRYLPMSEFGNGPQYSFGLQLCQNDEKIPGPQDYKASWVLPNALKAPSFTMRPMVESNTVIRPGPNAYHPKLEWSEKATTLKGYYKESKAMKTPGPANYIIPNKLCSGPQYSLAGLALEDNILHNPGPTDYIPNSYPVLSHAPCYSLGSRRPHLYASGVTPGPGTYEPKDRQIRGNDAPKVTLKSRHFKIIENSPGPADYNNRISNPVMSLEILMKLAGKTQAKNLVSKPFLETPGPASYDVKPLSLTKTAGAQYSLAKRLSDPKSELTPGPNSYHARPKLDGPRITMKSRPSNFQLIFPSNR
ncbi:hypothetical protein HK096_007224, partial [Nowakowskiella sp. JEL0078]